MADSVIGAIEDASPEPDALKLSKLPRNDFGLGERLRARFGDRIAHTPEAGWAAWNGEIWALGDSGEAQAKIFSHKTASALWAESQAFSDDLVEKVNAGGMTPKAFEAAVKGYSKFVVDAGNSGKTNAMLAQAAPYLKAKLSDFDPDKFRLTCSNGTLVFRFFDEPCIVWRDADGVVGGFSPVSAFGDDPVQVGIWPVTKLPDGVWQVGDETVDGRQLLEGLDLAAAGGRLERKLFHLDVRLVPHDPSHRITRMTGCAYDPKAKCPKWLAHIETVMAAPNDREFLHRALGYGITGSVESQCFVFHQGRGADGKSTTFGVIERVMGSYARICDPKSWLEVKQRSAADASPDIADMAGDTRLLYCEEPPKGARVNEALIKAASGGGKMSARKLHHDPFDFTPRFTLQMAFNDLPRVTGGDDGFWRRMRLLRWRHQFPEETGGRRDMVEMLAVDASGILNWLIEGMALWRHFGLVADEAMAADILEYRSSSNPFGDWFAERVERVTSGPSVRTKNSELYADYKEFLEAEGIPANEHLGSKAFSNQLASLQISMVKIRGERFRVGLRLREKEDWMKPSGGASGDEGDRR